MTKSQLLVDQQEDLYNDIADLRKVEKQKTTTDVGTTR